MYHMTRKSHNSKTGPIPVTTSPQNTCPSSCQQLRDRTCYALSGPLRIHWDRISRGARGVRFRKLLQMIRDLPAGARWRHNQAGDLPHVAGRLGASVIDLARANAGRPGWTYTHHSPFVRGNKAILAQANQMGFAVNLSADSAAAADKLARRNCGPVVCVLPEDGHDTKKTPEGRRVVVCPAQTNEQTTCETCGGSGKPLCARIDRDYVIGFLAHGRKPPEGI